jgi:hypothetical protein
MLNDLSKPIKSQSSFGLEKTLAVTITDTVNIA